MLVLAIDCVYGKSLLDRASASTQDILLKAFQQMMGASGSRWPELHTIHTEPG